jgi:transposase
MSGGLGTIGGMPMNFLAVDREQVLLMPPNLRDWLPEDHLAWFVLASVDEMDLSAFYASYRSDGHGRAAHDPAMMVALLLYAYSMGQRSSRAIERECVEDIAYRVIAANRKPDHATLARFVVRHEAAVAELFGEVLSLCADAGMVKVGVVAIDGTKVHANASQHSNRDYGQIAKEILAEAAETDRLEDELYGDKRGDELPPELATGEGRRAWLRDARRRLDQKRAADPQPVPRSRPKRLKESKRRLEEELWTESRANEAYEAYRARGVMRDGRRFGGPPKPYQPPETPAGKVNITDPDSRNVKTPRGYMQGYNAQAVADESQIVIAAEVNASSPDFGHLEPMVNAAQTELTKAGVTETPQIVVADAGYWHQTQIENVIDKGIQVLIPPDAGKRKDTRPGWQGGQYSWMRYVLATDHGHAIYRRRQVMIEPVFAQTKFNRRIDRFRRRGRGAVRSEWRLITATHNLLKLHKHQIALAGA